MESIITPENLKSKKVKSKLPKEKQTVLNLYVTSKEAYDLWKNTPKKVKILDVRTLDEYIYVGHAPMAWNIPAFLRTNLWDAEKQDFTYKLNSDFSSHVKELFQPEDIILVTCRSGGRSALAVNFMATLGYKNVYNITDGFEGDTVKDPESLYHGQRLKNGWKNSGLAWTYKMDIGLLRISNEKET